MRIRLSVTHRGPRHDSRVPWWRVTYREGGEEHSEFIQAWTRGEAEAEVSGPGVSVLRTEPVGQGRA